MMMRVAMPIMTCALLLASVETASANPFKHLWIFGDSTVDTGWYRKTPYSGEHSYDVYIKHPSYDVGRPTSSPGKMSVEVLADALGVSATPQNQQGGTNYATGGARDHYPNTAASGGFPNAVPTEKQIANYLSNHTASSGALYLISSGDNDVAFLINHPNGPIKPTVYLKHAADSLAKKINALHADGAKYIIVAGLPESFGSSTKKSYRVFYNNELKNELFVLGVPYLWGDVDRVRKLIEQFANQPGPSPFAITNYAIGSTACPACAACPEPPANQNPQLTITTDWAYVCSASAGAASSPINAEHSEWADDNHWATAAQRVLGTYYYCVAQKNWTALNWPASNTNLPFDCKDFSSVL
jgi:GDSL-like Lipase/Acylhydrolase